MYEDAYEDTYTLGREASLVNRMIQSWLIY